MRAGKQSRVSKASSKYKGDGSSIRKKTQKANRQVPQMTKSMMPSISSVKSPRSNSNSTEQPSFIGYSLASMVQSSKRSMIPDIMQSKVSSNQARISSGRTKMTASGTMQ